MGEFYTKHHLDQLGKIHVVDGDITSQDVDAIVNAANAQLKAGTGVDGAIHTAAGPELQTFLDNEYNGCPTGECRLSPGFNLKAKYIIHAVGPMWYGGHMQEDNNLTKCYLSALKLAREFNIRSLAFPAISTGVYRFPVERASYLALHTVLDNLDDSIDEVRFVCAEPLTLGVYRAVMFPLLAAGNTTPKV